MDGPHLASVLLDGLHTVVGTMPLLDGNVLDVGVAGLLKVTTAKHLLLGDATPACLPGGNGDIPNDAKIVLDGSTHVAGVP